MRLGLGLDFGVALHVLLEFLDEFEFEWHIESRLWFVNVYTQSRNIIPI